MGAKPHRVIYPIRGVSNAAIAVVDGIAGPVESDLSGLERDVDEICPNWANSFCVDDHVGRPIYGSSLPVVNGDLADDNVDCQKWQSLVGVYAVQKKCSQKSDSDASKICVFYLDVDGIDNNGHKFTSSGHVDSDNPGQPNAIVASGNSTTSHRQTAGCVMGGA